MAARYSRGSKNWAPAGPLFPSVSLKVESKNRTLHLEIPAYPEEVDPSVVQVEIFAAGRDQSGTDERSIGARSFATGGWISICGKR